MVVLIDSQDRFLTFQCKSPIICNPIPTDTSYSHASHTDVPYTLSNFFKSSNMKEKKRDEYFFYVFFNGKKNGSEFFWTEMQIHFLFYFFQICLRFDGYLFIITIITYGITTAIARPPIIIVLIDSSKKIFFRLCQKMTIWMHFLSHHIEYLIVLLLIFILFMDMYKFFLYYHCIYNYELYENMKLLYIAVMYNSYKKIGIVCGIVARLIKNHINVVFHYETTSITNHNNIILTNRYVCMFIYFLKFFVSSLFHFMLCFWFFWFEP